MGGGAQKSIRAKSEMLALDNQTRLNLCGRKEKKRETQTQTILAHVFLSSDELKTDVANMGSALGLSEKKERRIWKKKRMNVNERETWL